MGAAPVYVCESGNRKKAEYHSTQPIDASEINRIARSIEIEAKIGLKNMMADLPISRGQLISDNKRII